ncbi:MAG: hypothetical protein GY862_23985 [Gammaproteobacteria bacterium]|nr:hypothetical protein [Gammaproteobacteria bacterium]
MIHKNFLLALIVLCSVILSSETQAYGPLVEKRDVYFFAIMQVKSCALDKAKEGFWISSMAKVAQKDFNKNKFRKKVKRHFRGGRAFLDSCKWRLYFFKSYNSIQQAKTARKSQRQTLARRGRIHPWRLNVK